MIFCISSRMAPIKLPKPFIKVLRDALEQYPECVPSDLQELDKHRFITIPEAVATVRGGGVHKVTKKELVQLVEWKLKHGKFRPSLMKLVNGNDDGMVEVATAAAFDHMVLKRKTEKRLLGSGLSSKSIDATMGDITVLRGVGPATASLVLSVYSPRDVPFFSDELFRLLHWREDGKSKGSGWSRKIGYTMKEYRSLYEKAAEMREALAKAGEDWAATDLEKAAWVLGRDGVDVGPLLEGEGSEDQEASEVKASDEAPSKENRTRKRKKADANEAASAGNTKKSKR